MTPESAKLKIFESVNKTKDNLLTYIIEFFTFLKRYILSIKIALFLVVGFIHFFYPIRWIEYGFLPGIFEIIFFYVLIDFVFSFIQFSILYIYRKRTGLALDSADNFTIGIGQLSFLISMLVFVFVILFLFGIDLKGILTTLGLFAVAITLIFKDYISSFINGMIIMFSKDLGLKEYVKIGDIKGRVVDITFLKTKLKTDEGDVVFIPNNIVLSKEVINYSKSSTKKVRLEFTISITNSDKIINMEEFIAKRLCKEFENLVLRDNVTLKISDIQESKINLLLEVVVTRYNFRIEEQIKKSASYALLEYLGKMRKSKTIKDF